MSDLINPSVGADFVTISITPAELQGANTGQRPDLLARPGAIYKLPNGKFYSVSNGQLTEGITTDVGIATFGGVGDGTTDDTSALNRWLANAATVGGEWTLSPGVYKVSGPLSCTLTKSLSIYATGAKLIAAAGFATNSKMVQISGTDGGGHTLKWIGGSFDASNQPNSGAGEANDIFSINTTAGTCGHCHVELDSTVSGVSWLASGSDSHLFIGGPSNIIAIIHNCVGAKDAGIYISRNFEGAAGECLEVKGNFYKCNVSAIVKRQFKTATVKINTTDCKAGAGTGTADIASAATANGGSGYIFEVNAKRTENPIFLQAVNGVTVLLQSEDVGVSIPGYASTGCNQLVLQGAKFVKGSINVSGVNPLLTNSAAFLGISIGNIVTTAGTLESTDNDLDATLFNIGRSFAELNSSDRNFLRVREYGLFTSTPALTGVRTTWIRNNVATPSMEYVMPSVSLGGQLGTEALKVNATASQVNAVAVTGSATATAAGPTISTMGADTDVPLSIAPKGVGTVYIGGQAGGESLRVSRPLVQVNSVRVAGSATGTAVSIAAGGADANLNLSLSGKGSGGTVQLLGLQDFASDALAAAAGIALLGVYRTGNILKIRVV